MDVNGSVLRPLYACNGKMPCGNPGNSYCGLYNRFGPCRLTTDIRYADPLDGAIPVEFFEQKVCVNGGPKDE